MWNIIKSYSRKNWTDLTILIAIVAACFIAAYIQANYNTPL